MESAVRDRRSGEDPPVIGVERHFEQCLRSVRRSILDIMRFIEDDNVPMFPELRTPPHEIVIHDRQRVSESPSLIRIELLDVAFPRPENRLRSDDQRVPDLPSFD